MRRQGARIKKAFMKLIFTPQLRQTAADILSANHAKLQKKTKPSGY
jgi:hypothetical protein